MRWLQTLAVVLISNPIAFSQSAIQFNHYTVEHGLSDNIVNDIAQDNNGFTWLATTNGLNRFDGVQFKKFFRTGSGQQVPDNFIQYNNASSHRFETHIQFVAVFVYTNHSLCLAFGIKMLCDIGIFKLLLGE